MKFIQSTENFKVSLMSTYTNMAALYKKSDGEYFVCMTKESQSINDDHIFCGGYAFSQGGWAEACAKTVEYAQSNGITPVIISPRKYQL